MRTKHTAAKERMLKAGMLALLGLATFLFTAQLAQAAEVLSDDWQFGVAVYGWAPDIGGEAANGADVDISINDILDNLDFTVMTTFEAKKGKWGLLADVIFLDMVDNDDVQLGEGLTLTKVEMKNWIVTPMVTYNVVHSDRVSLNVLAGARSLYMKAEVTIDPLPTLSDSGTAWDGIVGARGQVDVKDKWYVPFHFDVGTGDTDVTWQAFGGVGYQFEKWDLVAGYRHLEWNFDNDDKGGGVFNDLTIGGPIVGASFSF